MIETLLSNIHDKWYHRNLDRSLHDTNRFHGSIVISKLSYYNVLEIFLVKATSRINHRNIAKNPVNMLDNDNNDISFARFVPSHLISRHTFSDRRWALDTKILLLFSFHSAFPRGFNIIQYDCVIQRFHSRFHLDCRYDGSEFVKGWQLFLFLYDTAGFVCQCCNILLIRTLDIFSRRLFFGYNGTIELGKRIGTGDSVGNVLFCLHEFGGDR